MHVQTLPSRRGAIVPLTALVLTGLLAFVALALDLGILMIARNQCQNAADAAAMAGARTLNGDTSTDPPNNKANAEPNAAAAAGANTILNTAIDTSKQLTVTVGDYYYDSTDAVFKINPSALGAEGNNWTLVQATVTADQPSYFARVFGMTTLSAAAKSTAAHRPRDAVVVVDFSGSMRFESMLASPYSGARTKSMNPDTVYPQFGHYNGNSSKLTFSADQQMSGGEVISDSNIAVTTTNATKTVMSGFFGDATAFGSSTPAFTSASNDYATTPGGDVPLKAGKNGTSTYAKTVSEFLDSSSGQTTRDWRFELDGYSAYSGGSANSTTSAASDYSSVPFNAYTQGPGYWGKFFMNWPPDPRVPLTTTYFTSTQIQNIVNKFLTDFGYTSADFANTSRTTLTAFVNSTSPTTIKVPATTAASFPTTVPFKVMVGTPSSGAFTGSPEVMSVTAVGATANGTTSWTVTRAQDGTSAIAAVTTTPFAAFTTTQTSIQVNAITGFPTGSLPFYIMVGTVSSGVFSNPEIMKVTAVGGTGSKTWTVTRGQESTTKVSGTTSMTVALIPGWTSSNSYNVGLLTGPPLYGTYTAASTTISATVGKTASTSSVWTSWTASNLGTYLTAEVYKPNGTSTKLTTSDAEYLQLLRLFNRNGGAGMPKNSAGTAMPCDWRARFFTTPGGAPLMDDNAMWNNGTMRAPSSSTYLINYAAILDWIKNCGTNPFPNQLRAGGILYYDAIPTTIDTSVLRPTNPNQRFWKEYIDEVLGLNQTGGSGSNPTYSITTSNSGYGADFTWGASASTSSQPSGWPTSTYISYTDTPKRPLLRGWFGPLSLVDYLGNYNASDPSNNNSARLWWPGTVPEAPTYQAKLGIQAGLKDMLQNHPNDNVGLVYFSSPRESATDTGYYNYARVPLCRDARLLINSLWFSPKVISTNAEIKLFNASGVNPGDIYDVPRANGGTCYTMGLMLAYNQFSANTSDLKDWTANASTGTAGGLGRNGATKMLIFESDGRVNTGAAAPLTSSTNGKGYYQIRIKDAHDLTKTGTEWPTDVNSSLTFDELSTQCQAIATQIAKPLADGGFATTGKPVKIHCLAFGSLFESTNTSQPKTDALKNLAALEIIGGVQATGATTLASNKIIVGDFTTRVNNLQAAFKSIMQDGVQVTLLSSGSGQP